MIIDIGVYRLDIDVERTKLFYETDEYIGCECDGCQNYENAVYKLPEEVQAFLRQFGIAPEKPARVSALYSPDGTETVYDGFYHICGTILDGKEPWVQVAKKHYHLDERYAIQLSGDFCFYFTVHCNLLDENFPTPSIQLEFTGSLPWVLDKPNPYI